jgi:hypothetical protein
MRIPELSSLSRPCVGRLPTIACRRWGKADRSFGLSFLKTVVPWSAIAGVEHHCPANRFIP